MENLVRSAFWRGKKVLVSGHTGFKGGWLCLWLQKLGAEVVGFSLQPPSTPSLFEVASVANGMVSLSGDIRDAGQLETAFAEYRPEIVFHLAAQALVRPSYQDPVGTYATNVMGTVNLLQAVRQTPGVRVVVNVTSDKCYENREWLWPYRENEALGGFDPYSSSKACAELVTASWRKSFLSEAGCALASVRAGNVIGGGDWAQDRLVPDIMNAIAADRTLTIRNPGAIRPWQHVLEPLHGYLLLAEKLWEEGEAYAEAWNFGPAMDDMRAVSWLTERLVALRGGRIAVVLDSDKQPHEAGMLKLDSSKARARLGWRPRLPLERSLEWVAAWYEAYTGQDDMRRLTEEQIAAYQALPGKNS